MAATLLDGKHVAKEIRAKLKDEVAGLETAPGLAVILVGDNPASKTYVRNKEKACQDVGIRSIVDRLPASTTQEALEQRVAELNEDPAVHGILVQLPLPDHLNEQRIINLINPQKDVDGFHPVNAGRLFTGDPGLVPCTPRGIIELLDYYNIPIEGKNAVVVGRSNIVGKPVAMLLLSRHATVKICHSRTRNLAEQCRESDILVAAVGRPEMITGDFVKEGAAVIDVGINRVDKKLIGDVAFEEVSKKAGFITPVPGGIGPMTIAMLLKNTVDTATKMF